MGLASSRDCMVASSHEMEAVSWHCSPAASAASASARAAAAAACACARVASPSCLACCSSCVAMAAWQHEGRRG